MRCAVCGRSTPEVLRWATRGGTDYGMACRGECAGLLWEAHFIRATSGSEEDQALILWRWRRRRAEVEGRRFDEPAPMTAAEQLAAAQQAYWGAAP